MVPDPKSTPAWIAFPCTCVILEAIYEDEGTRLGIRLPNTDSCASEELEYRILEGEAIECRLLWLHAEYSY